MAQSFLKDPNATLDYSVDWADWLDGDSISTSAWVVDSGITVAVSPAASNTADTATVWLSGGTLGESYTITNRITTAAGRIADRSIVIRAWGQ